MGENVLMGDIVTEKEKKQKQKSQQLKDAGGDGREAPNGAFFQGAFSHYCLNTLL